MTTETTDANGPDEPDETEPNTEPEPPEPEPEPKPEPKKPEPKKESRPKPQDNDDGEGISNVVNSLVERVLDLEEQLADKIIGEARDEREHERKSAGSSPTEVSTEARKRKPGFFWR